ncbi:MAG: phosphoribosylaminoimidazolesuccinocarboxamide synthase [Candidatus Thermoplasmatota archaeon]|nr:phosphoribosylaminoimidazolesuccinocarboxamide synthase [Candidatus Thermoplasmatota archaeon]MCL5789124.1 phosphoribosylaminoimidazolesuccinocarboxamide synthase [Candidatus Thermoplasmatota archaeon]
MKLLRKGKVKEVYDMGETLLFVFTDQISVFDKVIPSLVPDKGESLARTSAYWFERASNLQIPNHLLEFRNRKEMIVKKFEIIEGKASRDKRSYLVPLEFIVRYYVAGSLLDRIEKGKTRFQDLGFRSTPKHGDKIPDPLFEMTTKFEKTDRLLDISEAKEIGGLSDQDVEAIRETIFKVDREINSTALSRGLIHADGKKEFALDDERQPVLVDTFGTADEDRFWEKEDYEKNGTMVERSKEFVRQYYRKMGYYQKLSEARSRNLEEPPIPPLPSDILQETSLLYKKLYERITGQSW